MENKEILTEVKTRTSRMDFTADSFAKLVINDLSGSKSGRAVIKKYKQSEVREIIEGYGNPKNQEKLREISNILYAKSKQYQRLIHHYATMALFSYIVAPIKNIRELNVSKVQKQYEQICELTKLMNIRHEFTRLLKIAFKEDVFYGYVHRDKKSFYIQAMDASFCQISSNEDGIYNYSIDMTHFEKDESRLSFYAEEIRQKYFNWKSVKARNKNISPWVELSPETTICIKVNEEMREVVPPFAGTFDSIFDIDGFKQLRKDKEELGNYMILTQELPVRKDSGDNNDFLLDHDMFMYFHNMASSTVPDNVGVITSPMPVTAVRFDKDRADNDGVAKAERDFWASAGTSQLLFNADKTTSEGLKASIKTDEEVVFSVITQVQRWINRYLKYEFKDLWFNVNILHITDFNQKEKFDMYLQAGQYGIPTKNMISATIGLEPIEVMNMAYLENDILKMHEEFIPLQSSHTQGKDDIVNAQEGRPPKEDGLSDEGLRSRDKG